VGGPGPGPLAPLNPALLQVTVVATLLVRMIMELVNNSSFILTTGNGKRIRLQSLKNGVSTLTGV